MKIPTCLAVLLSLSALSFNAAAAPITYNVDWPAIHLEGTFTLDVGSAFGTYDSSSAAGTYGGLDGTYNTFWTSVQLVVQPSSEELTFSWSQGSTAYDVTPSYVGLSNPWTTAIEAWDDLIAKGASDGVFISPVPEPSQVVLTLLGLLLAMSRSTIRRSWQAR